MNSLPMRLRGCHKVITEPHLCGFPYHKEEFRVLSVIPP
ncbi:hypothetical protein T4B_5993 [Trichinella pseudospiralis]|uniref:Uncharacterized protein n=1 Tax=Trichinella pseudospiralis TaxID=6337 RepID=A0A0V1GJB4_TRIPS|nr:hypothetical protein T4B_5993 [Trichinella pseudospiralis]